MGVGPRPNCPDRSWCVATFARHAFKRRHRSNILTRRTLGKTPPPRRGKERLNSGISDKESEQAGSDYWLVSPQRSPREIKGWAESKAWERYITGQAHASAPLRCAPS